MPERSELLDSPNLRDGTAASQRGAAKLPCSPAELATGIVPVEGRRESEYNPDISAPEELSEAAEHGVGGFLGRPEGFQR
jgi:hypothetical protein